MITGDLAMDNFDKPAVRAAATSLLGRIRVPVHVVPGNHDIGDKPVLLFQHSPWFDDYYGNVLHPGWPENTRNRWAELVRSGPVKAVITGHCHRDELHWEGDVPVYLGEAAARFWGRQPAFRIYCFKDGRLSYRTWYLNDAPAEKKK